METRFPIFVSNQENKLNEFQLMVQFRLPWQALSLYEIQSMDLVEIASYKVKEAHERLGGSVWVEDTALFCRALNGLPGPLIKWFLNQVGPEGICQMLNSFHDRHAIARTAIAVYNGSQIRTFTGDVTGTIVLYPRGEKGFGWDSVFRPDGSRLTFGEMSRTEKNTYSMRARAFQAFLEWNRTADKESEKW
jgi:non-canonical purine NTP pyrophosphatase (RdgB/HAM1 family)